MKVREIITVCVMLMALVINANALTLKVASIAPQNSAWGSVLESIASQFDSVTDGDVRLRIFHNGIAGNEHDVLRKVNLGQLDIAIVTSIGVADIDNSVLTLSAPGLITSQDEFEHVLEKFSPSLQAEINETRYRVLGWAGVGWVYPFTDKHFRTPQDIGNTRIAVSDGDTVFVQFYRDNGINPVPLAFGEWLTALNSGLVGGFLSSPVAAAGFQWFGIANYMVNVRLAPFLGAFIVSDRAWAKVENRHKARLLTVIDKELAVLTRESIALEQRSIETMKRFGLNVIEPSDQEREVWAGHFDIGSTSTSGANSNKYRDIFDIRTYNLIKDELTDYRMKKAEQ